MCEKTKLALLVALLAATACSKPPEPDQGQPQARVETQDIRNTEVIGVAGSAIANQVDAVLQLNQAHKAALDASLDAETNPP